MVPYCPKEKAVGESHHVHPLFICRFCLSFGAKILVKTPASQCSPISISVGYLTQGPEGNGKRNRLAIGEDGKAIGAVSPSKIQAGVPSGAEPCSLTSTWSPKIRVGENMVLAGVCACAPGASHINATPAARSLGERSLALSDARLVRSLARQVTLL